MALRYYWLRDADNRPVACIATKMRSNDTLLVSIASHNPIDPFSKKAGRDVAAIKMAEDENFLLLVSLGDNIKEKILKFVSLYKGTKISTRAVNAAKEQLKDITFYERLHAYKSRARNIGSGTESHTDLGGRLVSRFTS